jgi:hypothetical protein
LDESLTNFDYPKGNQAIIRVEGEGAFENAGFLKKAFVQMDDDVTEFDLRPFILPTRG